MNDKSRRPTRLHQDEDSKANAPISALQTETEAALEVVIDANLILNFALGAHPYHVLTRQFLADCAHTNTRLIAPALWESEADTALRRMTTMKQLSESVASMAQQLLDAAPVTIVHEPSARVAARQIADEAKQVKVYDATYAAIAQVRGCQLWTADERFYNAIHSTQPFVRFIGHYTQNNSEMSDSHQLKNQETATGGEMPSKQ